MAGNRDISKVFAEIGGRFIIKPEIITARFNNIRAFLFDWDGVFNTGIKSLQYGSGFSEIDSMAINLIRYLVFQRSGRIPYAAIITGQSNPDALAFARRENFNSVYANIKDKKEAMEHFADAQRLQTREIAWFFDDVIDFSAARTCGLRIMVGNSAAPLTANYAAERGFADYITGHSGGNGALREAMEMLMGISGNFDEVLQNRITLSPNYTDYFARRVGIKPTLYTRNAEGIGEMGE